MCTAVVRCCATFSAPHARQVRGRSQGSQADLRSRSLAEQDAWSDGFAPSNLAAPRWLLSTLLTQHEHIQFGIHSTIQWKAEAHGWTCCRNVLAPSRLTIRRSDRCQPLTQRPLCEWGRMVCWRLGRERWRVWAAAVASMQSIRSEVNHNPVPHATAASSLRQLGRCLSDTAWIRPGPLGSRGGAKPR